MSLFFSFHSEYTHIQTTKLHIKVVMLIPIAILVSFDNTRCFAKGFGFIRNHFSSGYKALAIEGTSAAILSSIMVQSVPTFSFIVEFFHIHQSHTHLCEIEVLLTSTLEQYCTSDNLLAMVAWVTLCVEACHCKTEKAPNAAAKVEPRKPSKSCKRSLFENRWSGGASFAVCCCWSFWRDALDSTMVVHEISDSA
jgi:hypothetical protein